MALWPYSTCGRCPACRAGRTNSCQFNQTLGVQRDGALRERIAVHHSTVRPSETLSPRELALVEPLSVGGHAVGRAGVGSRDTVLVLGCGAVGLGAIASAAQEGATVIALDIDGGKLDLASRMGAEHLINASAEDPRGRIAELTREEGVSVAIEAVGASETYRLAVELTAFAARVAFIGYAKDEIPFDTRLLVSKELDIFGSRNALAEFRTVIDMLERSERPFTDLISRVAPFADTPRAFAEWSETPGGVTRILVEVGSG